MTITIFVLLVCLLVSNSSLGAHSVSVTSRIMSSSGTVGTITTIFETGFEAGDLSDVQVLEAWGGLVDIATQPVYQGSYSAKCRAWPTQNNGQGRARVAPLPNGVVPNLWEGYIEALFNIQSWDGYIEVLEFSGHLDDGTYVFICWVSITQNTIKLRYLWPEDREVVVHHTFETGTWYRIGLEFKIDKGNGYYRVYLDNQKVIYVEELDNTVAAVDTGMGPAGTPTPSANRAWAGIILCYSGGTYFELYVDDLKVTSRYVSS